MSQSNLIHIIEQYRNLPKYDGFGKELTNEDWLKLYFETQEQNFDKMKKFEAQLNKILIRKNRQNERALLSLQSPTSRFNKNI
tara:strand:- start:2218 stop:2466 length:249 start_codon:yes stop_codon:yes gene_type:complete